MKNTSTGHHTFAIFKKLNESDYAELISDFARYLRKNDDMSKVPIKNEKGIIKGWIFYYKINR